jgi:steroid delta-isomerase
MTADAATIRATVEAYCAAFTAGDGAAYVALFAEDAWLEDPVGSPRIEGHEAIGGFFEQSSSMAESIELRLTGSVRVAAGEAAFPMQARPSIGGTTFGVDIIDVMTFDDAGRITTMRAFWDPAEMRPVDDA